MEKLNCYAVTLPGLESIVADELNHLAVSDVTIVDGGVQFQATMDGVYRVNLRIRAATRIVIRLAEFRTHSFPELYNKAKKIHWERYVTSASTLDVQGSCHGSKLAHSGRVAKAVGDAISDRLSCSQNREPQSTDQQTLFVRMDDDICTISIDTSGERLDRRGYRRHSGRAPLRETMAAAILQWINWQPSETLMLPMCGSGTFAVEAVWLARRRAPGLDHDFPFQMWPGFKQKRWLRILDKTVAMQCETDVNIFASDLDGGILDQARGNAELAGVSDQVHFSVCDVLNLKPAPTGQAQGVLICNPPYGDRIKGDVRGLYQQLGALFRAHYGGWRIAVIVPDIGCENALAMPVKQRLKIKHGGKWIHLLQL